MNRLSVNNRENVWPRRTMTTSMMDDLFNDFDQMVNSIMAPTSIVSRNFSPTCDIRETKDHFLLSFDVPGIKKSDISVEVRDKTLTISGERQAEQQANEESGYLWHERSSGSFKRSFTLPASIEADNIEAHYEDGVLNIALPKTEQAKGRTIKIQSGQSKGLFSKLLGSSAREEKDVQSATVS